MASLSSSILPRAPKASSVGTERSVKSDAGRRVSMGSAPGRKRAPHVKIRPAIDTSAKRERAPTRAHRALKRDATKIRWGLASGIIRQLCPIGFEQTCCVQKHSTRLSCAGNGEKSLARLAPAPAWSRRIMNRVEKLRHWLYRAFFTSL